TADGLTTLREGRLPRLQIGSLIACESRAVMMLRLSLANVEALRAEFGPLKLDLAFRIAVDAIIQSVRETDFASADGATSMIIAFPETSAGEVSTNVVDRLRNLIRGTIAAPLELSADILTGEEIAGFLAES